MLRACWELLRLRRPDLRQLQPLSFLFHIALFSTEITLTYCLFATCPDFGGQAPPNPLQHRLPWPDFTAIA